jgi:hypothetical protein
MTEIRAFAVDEDDDGQYIQLGAERVRIRRGDMENRYFAVLPASFKPDKQVILTALRDEDPAAAIPGLVSVIQQFLDVPILQSPSTELLDAARAAIFRTTGKSIYFCENCLEHQEWVLPLGYPAPATTTCNNCRCPATRHQPPPDPKDSPTPKVRTRRSKTKTE